MNSVSDEKRSTYHLHFIINVSITLIVIIIVIIKVSITLIVYGSISQNTSVNLVCGAKSEKISHKGSGCLFWLIKCDSDTHKKKLQEM